MEKSFYASVIILSAVLLWQRPAQAGTLFFDDMESGSNGWTVTGLWHQQTDPQKIQVSSEISPDLVSLPNFGYLPYAYSDSTVWWYGSADDGTFMGTWTSANQTEKNGGLSDEAHSGTLISPSIDLTSAPAATLTFWHWWEVEGVDVDRYDLITVSASTDGGQTWTPVVTLNPANDVDGESYVSYSSGGLGQAGQWLFSTVDLSAYIGSTIQLEFTFDTVDEKYNGFRGWFIDDVKVTDDETVKTSFDAQTTQATAECFGSGETDTPAQFYIQRAQGVQVTSDGNWYITPAGSEDYVATGTPGITSKVYLNSGFYELWVNFTADQTCPDALPIAATASFYGGPGQPTAQTGTLVTFYGDGFISTSTVQFTTNRVSSLGVTAATDADAVVVSSTELQVTIPFGLSDGTYNLKVTQPNGTITILADAMTVTSDAPPDIISVAPEEIDDATATDITITGTGFVDGAVATVGGLPVTGLTVTATEITGNVPVGGANGYQNVVVINPDGQVAKLVGGIYIDDNSTSGYTPGGSAITAPDKVTGVKVKSITKKSAKVIWDAVDGAATYTVQLERGGKIVRTIESTDTKEKIKNLKLNRKYKVQVRAFGTYLGGTLSKVVRFTTH